MAKREPPLLDLTPEGEFREPARPFGRPPFGQPPFGQPPFGRPGWAARLAGWALVIALVAGGFAAAALAFWVALTLIPVAIAAGLIAYAAFRFNLWRRGR